MCVHVHLEAGAGNRSTVALSVTPVSVSTVRHRWLPQRL